MPPRKRKRRSRKKGRRVVLWLCLALLAVGVGVLGGYLYRQVPPLPPARRVNLEPFQTLVGPIDARGTRVQVADRGDAVEKVDRLRAVAGGVGEARVDEVTQGPGGSLRTTLHVAGRAYPLELWWLVPKVPPEPRLVVVIDDLGGSVSEAEQFFDLPITITPAILSNLPHSEEVARVARERRREFLLHLPMEPQGYPDVNPGDGALLASMDEGTLRRALAQNLSLVRGAAGVNNHMGSRLTELDRPMAWVMDELSARGLYFLDSLTSPKSVAAKAAAQAGLRWARRDVFLDNVREEAAVARQLDKVVEIARKKGVAVAIGHPHEATLHALERWVSSLRATGVRVVPLGDVLRLGDGV